MTYTINQKDIDTTNNIFSTIGNIHVKLKTFAKDNPKSLKSFSIIFNESVNFVNPLFFSLILQIHEKYFDSEIVLVLDILNFIQDEKYDGHDPRQHYIYRILLSSIDTPHFELYHRQTEDNIVSFRDKLNTHINIKDKIYKNSKGNTYKKFIVLLYSRKHTDTIFLTEDKDKSYKLLPIIKITNFPEYIYSNELSNNEFDGRKKIYESITITTDRDYDPKALQDTFENNFLNIIKPESNHNPISQPIKSIFFEMMDNIKRHAKYNDNKYADSYFNFYYDVPLKTFKFHIIDNLDTGFINTYVKTITEDMKTLEAKGLDASSMYNDALNELKNPNNDIKFLELLFSEYGWFRATKIPRIILHFGIPLLVKIIKSISGKIYIRLHREHEDGDKFYEIVVESSGTKVKEITEKKEQLRGTYIAVDIPDKEYIPSLPLTRSFGKVDFKNMHNEKDRMIKHVKSFVQGANKKEQYMICDYGKAGHNKTISDFIRDIYIESHQKDISDVLVVDIDLKENIEYFKTLAYLLYHKDYTVQDDFLPVNILFWNRTSFDIFFIGGKDRFEFCKSNQLLYSQYGQKNYFILDELCLENGYNPAQSIFFIGEDENNLTVLPFELLIDEITYLNNDEIWSKLSYQRTIINHLEENKLDVHFDTRQGYHVDGFYRFDSIFQNSSFFERLAYIFITKIYSDTTLKNKKLVFIGFGKYLNLFISTLISKLTEKGINCYQRYHIVTDGREENENTNIFIESAIKDKQDKLHFIMLSSVLFAGNKFDRFIKKYMNGKEYICYGLIQIVLENQSSPMVLENIESLMQVEISEDAHHDLNEYCLICSNPKKEKPLLKIDKHDEFKLEKTYFSPYELKAFKSDTKVDDVKFYNSISFGHITRGSGNHYLYYTKTVNFFEDNRHNKNDKHNIESFLNQIHDSNPIDNPSHAVLLLPMHSTVNRFASLVYRMIFAEEANVFQFDKSKGIKNFHELKKQLKDGIEYKFYFVDDEMSSGFTLEYFYSLVRYCGGDSFEKIFILIDRLDSVDEKLVLNHIKGNDKNNIHIFSKMEVKPIKTVIEDCFLCETQQKYKKALKHTFIDMNRFALADRIVKLNIQDSKLYDFEESKKFKIDDFKTYLKMYAVDYIYEHFDYIYMEDILDTKRDNIVNHYSKIETDFIAKVQEKITLLSFIKQDSYRTILERIAEYEGSIAFMKALSFPKLVYYYNIRYMVTVILIKRIGDYLGKEPIEFILDPIEVVEFIEAQGKKTKYKEFLEHFSKKINMNYISFLYKTAAYLDIHYVIHIDNVRKYYMASKKIKDHDEDNEHVQQPYLDQSLVEYYQLASKMVAEYSEDRTRYLEENIKEVFEEDIDGYDNLLGALLIENHHNPKIQKFQKEAKQELNLQKKPEEILEFIEERLSKIMEDNTLKIHALYVNKYTDLEYNSYADYIKKMELVDIINNYQKPYEGLEDIEERLTKGYLTRRKNEFFNPNDSYHKQRINNTWSNLSTSKYILNDGETSDATLVKLVDINPDKLNTNPNKKIPTNFIKENESLWYKPIGCIVATYAEKEAHEKEKYRIKLSQYLLSIQDDIVFYLKGKFSSGAIQEGIDKKYIEYKMDEKTTDIIANIQHSVKDYIDISGIIQDGKVDNEQIAHYTKGLKYMSSIALVEEEKSYTTKLYDILYDAENEENKTFLDKEIKQFIQVAHLFSNQFWSNIDSKTLKVVYDSKCSFTLKLDKDQLRYFIFEFIFNALKAELDDSTKKPQIIIELDGENLYISNSIADSKIESAIAIINEQTNESKRQGIKRIKRVLQKNNYRLMAKKEPSMLKICIERENK